MSKEKDYCVYKHTNKTNGKSYIGMTKNISTRWRNNGIDYKRHSARDGGVFWKAIQKYGWDGFTHEVLASGLSFNEACIAEQYFIRKYNTNIHNPGGRRNGYNLTDGGDGTRGRPLSQKEKDNLSKINSGSGNPMYGKKQSEFSREKISEKITGRFIGAKSPLYGKHPTEETVEKLKTNHADVSGGKNPRAKPVLCIETGTIYPTISEASVAVGNTVNRKKIPYACKNENATAYGFHWKYA